MKKRKLLGIVGLTIITLGIYDIVWLVKTKKELNAKTTIHVPSIWILIAPFILFLVGIIGFFVSIASSTANTLNNTASTYTVNNSYGFNTTTTTTSSSANVTAFIFIILYIVGIILTAVFSFYWFFKFSKAVEEYTNRKMSKGETFLLLWVLHMFGVLMLQDTFNEMIDDGTVPGETTNQPSQPVQQAPVQPPVAPQPMVTPVAAPTPIVVQPTTVSPDPTQAPVPVTPQPITVISPTTPAPASSTPLVQ